MHAIQCADRVQARSYGGHRSLCTGRAQSDTTAFSRRSRIVDESRPRPGHAVVGCRPVIWPNLYEPQPHNAHSPVTTGLIYKIVGCPLWGPFCLALTARKASLSQCLIARHKLLRIFAIDSTCQRPYIYCQSSPLALSGSYQNNHCNFLGQTGMYIALSEFRNCSNSVTLDKQFPARSEIRRNCASIQGNAVLSALFTANRKRLLPFRFQKPKSFSRKHLAPLFPKDLPDLVATMPHFAIRLASYVGIASPCELIHCEN